MRFSLKDIIPCFTDRVPFLISGPCALTDEKTVRRIASFLIELRKLLNVVVIFKGSYEKANRTTYNAFHGIGIDKGTDLLRMVRNEYNIPTTTDIHESIEISKLIDSVDLIQIPALLCKQTRLIFTVAEAKIPINIKKGQFMPIYDMQHAIEKARSKGNKHIMVTERGTIFGYSDMINDFRSIPIMKEMNVPVVYDGTHSIRIMSERSNTKFGAKPEFIRPLCHCAAAIGADGLFLETYPDPKKAPCDSAACIDFDVVKQISYEFFEIKKAISDIKNAKL